ncbi:MAG: heavy metal translocating P-type ATPase metal-binding domain-containing protein, partial [Gemmatimonadetes bacterium]|nr:heavy metal translocating P-type ATPase metal-binding domain-containing protein [Gemmatimonadota bacterium]
MADHDHRRSADRDHHERGVHLRSRIRQGRSRAVLPDGIALITSRCPHCGTPVEGPEDTWCCHGCEMAAAIIRDAGLERYYEERSEYAPRPGPLRAGWDAVPVTECADGTTEVRLVLDGLRCASCVWVTEHILQATPGVAEATVSYATGRASLRWDPDTVDLGTLAGRVAALGYRPRLLGEESRPDQGLVIRLGVATFAAMNIMMMSAALYLGWVSAMEERYAALFRWASLLLVTPVALWCAEPFFSGAVQGLKNRVLHMDLPIALAVAVLYVHGLVSTIVGTDTYFDSLAMLVALLLAGRMLEGRGRRRAAEAAVSLAAALPATARRRVGDSVEVVPAGDLVAGDLIDVGAGEEFAADGVVAEGKATVRLALITGEAEPVAIAEGDEVVSGAVLVDGALTVRVERAGEETTLQRMAADLRTAADRPVRLSTADRIAPWFTAATLGAATLTATGWLLAGDGGTALRACVAVLVVACPCALALSRPLAAAAGLGAAARRGLLFRSADGLLDLVDVDTVGLDKTGTVTHGDLTVVSADDATLRIAAGLERFSMHPIARAIIAEAVDRGIPLPKAEAVSEVPGKGVAGRVDGADWELMAGGPGEVVLRNNLGEAGRIRLGDVVRPDSSEAVARLEARGLQVVLLTGDHEEVAGRIAAAAGVTSFLAEIDPAGKASWVRA